MLSACLVQTAIATPVCAGQVDTANEDLTPRPNIVFILIDDMGWPDMACYGHVFHETPVLDELAQQGMKFTDFYAATPVCSSTRSTIQTGQYSARTGITDFIPGHWRPFERFVVPTVDGHLDPNVQTVGDALKAAGYVTGYFGKWHLGGKGQQPSDRGYDVTQGTLGPEFSRWRINKNPGPKRIDLLTDHTLWFLEKYRAEPFFVTLSHHAVHIPVEGRDDTIRKYQQKRKPSHGVNHPIYAAMVEDLDRSIGRILERLDQLGLAQRTMVVVTSDNGGLAKNYLGVGDTVSTNAPLRDEKGTLYEGGIRVPLIVRLPGTVRPGSICRQPTTTADLLPTFCEAVGTSLPEQPIDGSSFHALLRDPSLALERDAVYFHYPHYHHSRPAGAIRAGDWKLIEFFEDGDLELYNLRDDPSETTNLADKHPKRADRLRTKLMGWRQRTGARMPTPNPKHDPQRADEWWNRRTNRPLDVAAIRERLDTPRAK